MRVGLLPALALVVICTCWGYSWILNKLALLDAGPFSFSACRMALASLALLAALPLTGRSLRPVRPFELALLGLVQTTGFVGLSMWALVSGGVASTSILVFTMPFWTLLLAWPLLGERVRGAQWVAIALAAAGLVVILQPWTLQGSLLSKMLGIASGVLWAIGSIMVKRMQRTEPRDLLSLTAWQMAFGAPPLFALALLSGEPPVVWTARFAVILGGTALVSTALCWWLWAYVLKHVDAGIAGLSVLAVPVIAILSAAWHFGERPRPEETIGMSLILFALLLTGVRALHRRVPVSPLGQEA
ncbi:MAG: DMT family transporter [Gammaproteobacteria bacterium]